MKKNISFLLAVAWFVLACFIIGVFVLELKSYMQGGNRQLRILTGLIGADTKEKSILNKTSFDADEITLIKASLRSRDIEFVPATDDTVTVEIVGSVKSEMLPDIRNENGCLYIEVQKQKKHLFQYFLFGFYNAYKIVVSLPKPVDVQIEGTSSDVQIGAVKLKSIYSQTTSGDISFENTEIENGMTVIGTSADIIGSVACPKFDMQTTSGDCKMKFLSVPISGITHQSTSGDCILYLPEDIAGFNVQFSSSSGDYSNEFTSTNGERSILESYADGSVALHIKTTSGDCKILKR